MKQLQILQFLFQCHEYASASQKCYYRGKKALLIGNKRTLLVILNIWMDSQWCARSAKYSAERKRMFSTLSARTADNSLHCSLYTLLYSSCPVFLVPYVKRPLYPKILVFRYCRRVCIPLTFLMTNRLCVLILS